MDADATAGAVVHLGRMALDFARVDRITYHPDGRTPESDTDHTVMLGLIACALADRHFPHLDVGLIAQYAFVHDLPEVYAGDTPTLRIQSADAKAEKRQREDAAVRRIAAETVGQLPWVAGTVVGYEQLATPEARFVKALDKLLPKITHLFNRGVSVREQGMTRADLLARWEVQTDELMAYAADFPELFELRAVLAEWTLAALDETGDLVA